MKPDCVYQNYTVYLNYCFQNYSDDSEPCIPDFKCPLCSHVLSCQRDFTSHLRGHNEVKPSPDPSDPTGIEALQLFLLLFYSVSPLFI